MKKDKTNYTAWGNEYWENKEEYHKLFEGVMSEEQEQNVEFLEREIIDLHKNHQITVSNDRKFAVACASGTDALYFSLIGLGIKPGDEVLVTNFSWISSASVVSMIGATPVFCDINLDTYHMSLDSIKKMWSSKVKAIIYPHLFGSMSDTREILEWCHSLNIKFVEDACQALGASLNGIRAGTIGDVSALSFNANKPVAGIAGGGMLLTNSKYIADMARKLRRHGNGEILGYNSKMLLMNAQFISHRLKHLEEWQIRRQAVAKKYDSYLKDLNLGVQNFHHLKTHLPSDGLNHCYHKYVIRLPLKEIRDKLKERLKADVHYSKPISENSMYNSIIHRKDDCVNCRKASDTVLSLPIHPYVTDEEVERICKTIMATV